MNKEQKQEMVNRLGLDFQTLTSAFLIDYKGLKVVAATELRRKVREINGSYVVVKNSLAVRAAKDSNLEQLEKFFSGPTAVAYHKRDVVGLAKLLTEVAKANPSIRFKAAMVEGKVISTDEIQAIADLPSREVLLSRLVFLLKAPLGRLAAVLKAPTRNLALVLKQVPK